VVVVTSSGGSGWTGVVWCGVVWIREEFLRTFKHFLSLDYRAFMGMFGYVMVG
jgi:hypothetical protein